MGKNTIKKDEKKLKKLTLSERQEIVENLDELTRDLPKDLTFFTKLGRKYNKLIKKIAKKKILVTVLMLLFVFGVSIGIQYLFAYIGLWIFGRPAMVSSVGTAVFYAVCYSATLVIVIFLPKILYDKWKTNRDQIGLNGLPTWTDIGLAPLGYIATIILAHVVTAIFSFFPWFDANQAQQTGFSDYLVDWERVVAFIALVIIAPIVEEVIFRGWLYGKLRRRYAMPISILLTSVLFGVVHLQWNVGVNVFATSIILCGLREITGTVYSGILLHMLKNGIAFFLLYVLNVA